MLMYFLIGLLFVLIGIVGLQFTYLFFVDRIFRERKHYLQSLEKRYARLTRRLAAAELQIAKQNELIDTICPDRGRSDETWADVIEER
ncbi:MAG: hypothetical protein WBO10_10990 [Pyrinomonadaceae bacterium]